MSRDIKAVLVDLDGVIRRWSTQEALANQYCLPVGAIENVAFSPSILEPAIRGQITEAEWRERVAVELGRRYPEIEARQVVSQWSASPGNIDQRVLDLLDSARGGIRILLASNATSRLNADLEHLDISGRFDAVINSSDIGFIKPEHAYFRRALEVIGADAHHAVFIDDSLTNVVAARSIGMAAHHFETVSGLRAFLATYGVISMLTIRHAAASDAALLYSWDEKPHVMAATSNDCTKSFEADWEKELQHRSDGTEFFIASAGDIPIGAMQIIDPAREYTHYWGDVPNNLRAIDIWIGEEAYIGRGYGTEMMCYAINRCFSNPGVEAILIDPLSNNVRSHQFYKRLGFVFVERRVFDDDSDCFVFRLGRDQWVDEPRFRLNASAP